ncbi:MAG: hypothetical protein CVU39_11920 [Chloroflexi bacterium HGW-Chloroflexi-10]|nr:MAG: hypothetical protein CVU39_11920 [Chloroflexi bacterium HGW-Chloroflexi-10]
MMAEIFFRKHVLVCVVLLCICGLALGTATFSVQAASESGRISLEEIPGNGNCLECHDQPDWEWKLANGDKLLLSIEGEAFNQSVHKDMQCIECHIGYEDFPAPHNKITATNKRQYMVSYHDTCQKCHQEQFNLISGNVHDELYISGNLNTPLCADCHQPHTQAHMSELEKPQENGHVSWESQICVDCHQSEFDNYKESVHGKGLLAGDNTDMPDCVDCHNVHDINDPTQSLFRMNSVDTCAKCHSNTDVMEKYGLETNVLDTYLVFHDTTVTLIEEYNPDSLTNKPTCFDCHGIHEVGSFNPPPIEANISAMTLYPEVNVKQAGPPVENVGFTGVMIGILIGSIGAFTLNQLIKEKRENES